MKVDWVYNKKYRVTFNRSYEWIDPINPCTVVVPQASGIAVALIEAEVFKWILAFNNTHGVDEGIYEDGAFVMGKFYLFTATSHALAVYLCLRNGTRTMDRYTPPYPICESSDRNTGCVSFIPIPTRINTPARTIDVQYGQNTVLEKKYGVAITQAASFRYTIPTSRYRVQLDLHSCIQQLCIIFLPTRIRPDGTDDMKRLFQIVLTTMTTTTTTATTTTAATRRRYHGNLTPLAFEMGLAKIRISSTSKENRKTQRHNDNHYLFSYTVLDSVVVHIQCSYTTRAQAV